MNAHLVQGLSQVLNPLLALALIACAVRELHKSALWWLVCVALSLGLAQQISKIIQHARVLGPNFPSTHFAVALVIAGAFCALNRRFAFFAPLYLVAYAALILWQEYHTPLELLGALPALPLGFGAARLGTRRGKVPSN